jgi:hypothetical protein
VVLLLNLLIAMMGDTYAKVTSLVCQHSGQGRGVRFLRLVFRIRPDPFLSLGIRYLWLLSTDPETSLSVKILQRKVLR